MDALARDIGGTETTRSIGRIRRYWWLALLGAILGAGAGMAYTSAIAKQYVATTTLIVYPPPQQAIVTGARVNSNVNMDNELQFVQSVAVAEAAAKLLKVDTVIDTLESQVTATVPPNTSVIDIAFAAGTPEKALEGSHAFAEAYIQVRTDAAAADIAVQNEGLNDQVTASQKQLAVFTARIATLQPTSPVYQDAVVQSKLLETNISALQARITPPGAADTTAGAIINDAILPTAPSKPVPPLYIGAGIFAGLIFGLALAVLAARTDRKVRHADDVETRVGRPVLAEITKPARGKPVTGILSARTGSGEFDRLRLRLASATLDRIDSVLVCAADPGNAASFVAGNLAASQARSGQDVVLVCADPDSATAALFGISDSPGLSTALREEGPIDGVAQLVLGPPAPARDRAWPRPGRRPREGPGGPDRRTRRRPRQERPLRRRRGTSGVPGRRGAGARAAHGSGGPGRRARREQGPRPHRSLRRARAHGRDRARRRGRTHAAGRVARTGLAARR